LNEHRKDQLIGPGRLQEQLRSGAVIGLVGVALIHLLDLPSKLPDTVYLAVAYSGLIVACLCLAGALMHTVNRPLWLATAALSAGTLVAYVLSRTVGLPDAGDDVGNWDEALGIASLFVESLVVCIALYGWHVAIDRSDQSITSASTTISVSEPTGADRTDAHAAGARRAQPVRARPGRGG
jgi:hypothetical protein